MTQRGAHNRNRFSWTLAGNAVNSLSQWSFLIVLAKLGTPYDVGGYALGVAIASPVLMFANFQARSMVSSDINDEHPFGEYLSFRIVSVTLAMIGVAIIAGFTRHSIAELAVTCLLGASQAFESCSDTWFGLLQKYDRLDRVGQSLMLKGPVSLALLAGSMYFTRSLVWAVAGIAVGRGLVLWLFDSKVGTRLASRIRLVWDWRVLWGLFVTALPLGVISALNVFEFNVPRYFIEAKLNTRELGIFSAVASLVGAGNLVMSAFGYCTFVDIARAFAANDRKLFRSLSLRLFATGAVLGAAGVLAALVAGDRILATLFRPEYGGSSGVFTRLMLAAAVGYILSGQGCALTAARILLPQIPVFLFSSGVMAVFCWWLVPIHGLNGAAEASLLTSIIEIGLFGILIARAHRGERKTSPTVALREVVSAEAQ